MYFTLSPGCAMKNFFSEIDLPFGAPFFHEVPDESLTASGTNTCHLPLASTYRNGFSRDSGVAASVVYLLSSVKGPPAGAPSTPENTWFHTKLLQPSTELLRVMNCCCEPLTTNGSFE